MFINNKLFLSYNSCKKIFEQHSKTYYFGSCFYNFEQFKLICGLYGFVRVVDDIIDSEISIEEKKTKLEKIKNDYIFLFKIKNELLKTGLEKDEIVKNITENWEIWRNRHIIFRAFISSCIYLELDDNMIHRFIKSMEMDLNKFTYNTENELIKYVDGSAMVVGEIMLKVMLFKSDLSKSEQDEFYLKNIQYAQYLGYSFQFTNFIRDYEEDKNMKPSRRYLFTNENIDENNRDLFIKKNVDFNWGIYEMANQGINNLYTISQTTGNSIFISKILYSSILKKIEENNYNVDKRLRLTFQEKVKITSKYLNYREMTMLFINYIIYSFFFRFIYFLF